MKVLTQILKNVSVILFMAVLALAAAAVFFRYVLNDSIVWAEEVIRYLCIWVFCLTMCESTRTGTHLALDLIPGLLSGRPKSLLNAAVEIVSGAFDIVLIIYGIRLVFINMAQRSPALRIPYGCVYLAIPAGAALMLAFGIGRILGFVRELTGGAGKETET